MRRSTDFADSGKDVGLFFSSQPLPPDVDVAGVEMVRTFRDENRERCLYETFSDTNELERLLLRWLTRQSDDHAVALGTVLRSTPPLRASSRITARMTGTSRSHRIEVRNAGTIDVHDVTLSIPEEVGWLDLDAEPIDILRPGDTVKVMCSTHMGGGPSHFDIAIDARDGDGQLIDTQYSKINS